MADLTIRYSRGEKKFDNAPLQRKAVNFDAFEEAILSDRSPRKGEAFFCCALGRSHHPDEEKYPFPDHYRLADNALTRRFITMDHDGYSSPSIFEAVIEDLNDFRGFAYTTFSHTEEKPRARIVLELDREVTREEGVVLGACLDELLENAYGVGAITSDKTSYRAEQPSYCPGVNATIFRFDGKPVDVDAMFEKYGKAPPQAKTGITTSQTGRADYALLEAESLVQVLSKIDPFDEPIWFSVACGLARPYGEEGRDYFLAFSRGDYWSEIFPEFDNDEANDKFTRALKSCKSRPDGYGVRHLIQLAGLDATRLKFEEAQEGPTDVSSLSSAISKLILPILDAKNRPLSVQENLIAVLLSSNVIARYNAIKKRSEIIVPGLNCVADEASNSAYTTVTDLAIKAGMSAGRIPELLDSIASQNPFCPVQTYIKSKPWDGIRRFPQFLAQLDTANAAMTEFLFRKWLIQAVAAVFEPDGISNAGALILSGGQGIGKTRLFHDLTSGVQGVFAEGLTLNPADKDSCLYALSHWIVELGELESTFKKADLSQLKAFITKKVDLIRKPYARKESNLPRRTAFAGTVNDAHCLHDTTGNRRFWPTSVNAIHRDETIDYQQLWAEAHTWYSAGETWYLSDAEKALLESHCESFMVVDPDIEALLDYYPFFGCKLWKEEKMMNICSDIGIEKPTKYQTMRLAEAIRKYNGGHVSRKSNGVAWHRVPDRIEINKLKAAAEHAERAKKAPEEEQTKPTGSVEGEDPFEKLAQVASPRRLKKVTEGISLKEHCITKEVDLSTRDKTLKAKGVKVKRTRQSKKAVRPVVPKT
jgi:hypothetical protein